MSYGNGYAVFGQAPVIVGHVKAPETDAQRADRLAQEVGRLEYELRTLRASLSLAMNGDARAAAKFDAEPEQIELEGVTMTVAVWHDPDGEVSSYVTSVWTGSDWMPEDWLCEDFRDRAMAAVKKAQR